MFIELHLFFRTFRCKLRRNAARTGTLRQGNIPGNNDVYSRLLRGSEDITPTLAASSGAELAASPCSASWTGDCRKLSPAASSTTTRLHCVHETRATRGQNTESSLQASHVAARLYLYANLKQPGSTAPLLALPKLHYNCHLQQQYITL